MKLYYISVLGFLLLEEWRPVRLSASSILLIFALQFCGLCAIASQAHPQAAQLFLSFSS